MHEQTLAAADIRACCCWSQAAAARLLRRGDKANTAAVFRLDHTAWNTQPRLIGTPRLERCRRRCRSLPAPSSTSQDVAKPKKPVDDKSPKSANALIDFMAVRTKDPPPSQPLLVPRSVA